MMNRYLAWLIIIVAGGCIDPVNLKTGTGGTLVVEGWITDQPGPYTIKLSRSVAYDNSQPLKVFSIPETNAVVSVVDNAGNAEIFHETTTKGMYSNALTSTFQAKVGSSYKLSLRTGSGKLYHSAFDTLN